ncbi:hypothetical protein DAERI_210022 [Deinococcus aerius]|uniref:Uncharacterized protein n=1 Tax=Deinococcus aerius TaxID=200253 RepID=A0A2I9DAQ6_9DEIO|nr:hypothetical protein [Deinococcus aerius]GBF08026.1 hypothetical protein DAERI_210022 [Deinococcus aerius]
MKLRTLIHLATRPDPSEPEDDRPRGVRAAARRAAETVLQAPQVQDRAASLKERAQELRAAARSRADQHLEGLIESAAARRGESTPSEVAALLARRRREREEQAARLRARQALLALAEGPEQRRVLTLVAQSTPWAGGTEPEVRYTALLDRLAPSGSAEAEMGIHRALWTLAERRVLAVSPHGVVTACPLTEQAN